MLLNATIPGAKIVHGVGCHWLRQCTSLGCYYDTFGPELSFATSLQKQTGKQKDNKKKEWVFGRIRGYVFGSFSVQCSVKQGMPPSDFVPVLAGQATGTDGNGIDATDGTLAAF